jgi:isocitrate dehydrogenase kinase/phosphatase
MFPQRLDAPEAYAIAQALMHGFNQHYRMFSAEAARAKQRFETMDWLGQQQAQRERIEFYDRQVVPASRGWKRSLPPACRAWLSGSRSSCITSA